MASTISASWTALYDLLVAAQATTLAGVQVTAGPPMEYEAQEVVALMGWGRPDEDAAIIGGNAPREERYQIEVAIKAHDPSGTALTVVARLLAIADAVRDVVKANKRLTGEVMCAVVAREGKIVPALNEDGTATQGWVSFDTMQVECWAPRVS